MSYGLFLYIFCLYMSFARLSVSVPDNIELRNNIIIEYKIHWKSIQEKWNKLTKIGKKKKRKKGKREKIQNNYSNWINNTG